MISRYLRLLVTFFAVSLIVPVAALAQTATPVPGDACDVTLPNGETPPGEANDARWLGSGQENASLWLFMHADDGVYSSQPDRYQASNGHVTGHALKFALFRGAGSGDVTLTAIDANGTPLLDERRYLYPEYPQPIPGLTNFVVVVPDTGCWTLTASDGNDTLAWTALVTTAIDGCDVTLPNGEAPPDTHRSEQATRDWYGSGAPDASLWLMRSPSAPIIPVGVFDPRDKGGYTVKTPFWRGEGSGPITLTGERLDAPSDLEPHIDAAWDGYPTPGFVATGIWYPSAGCWELTATDGNDTLTWTVLLRSPYAACPVTSGSHDEGTLPEDVIPAMVRDNPIPPDPDDFYGENGLYVTIGNPIGHFPIDSELVSEDGAIFDKFVWYRHGDAEGQLSITVENTAQWFPNDPEIIVPSGYGSSGVQASGITFPGPGCWEITGTSGDVSITFTVRLEIVPAQEP